MTNETFQRYLQEIVEQEKNDPEVMHISIDELMLDALKEVGIDSVPVVVALSKCWSA